VGERAREYDTYSALAIWNRHVMAALQHNIVQIDGDCSGARRLATICVIMYIYCEK